MLAGKEREGRRSDSTHAGPDGNFWLGALVGTLGPVIGGESLSFTARSSFC